MGGKLSVSNEHTTLSETSIKSSYNGGTISVDGVYLISNDEIGRSITISFDGYSESQANVFLIIRDNNQITSMDSSTMLPKRVSSKISLTLNEIPVNTYSIFFRVAHDSSDPIFVSNVNISIQ